ncbi:(2Fe-2S)-binding protein [bacterium]|nr:(2Fe-2S)-binding protein [bacterium]
MSFSVRDGKFDVLVAAGPRISHWPSAGVRALSAICADLNLSVGLLGGETLFTRGVIPLSGTGGLVLAEDVQHRVHRMQARAIVRVVAPSHMPDPFPGSRSQGLIPLSTVERLLQEGQMTWNNSIAILGSGNQALRLGNRFLTMGVPEVFCIESASQWGAKRISGWEVEKRRFEMNGGKLVEAKPVKLSQKSALLWELRLADAKGIRVIEVSRVIGVGPYSQSSGIRENPPGSLLFELEQTAPYVRIDDFEGWVVEEERGRLLALKIVKSLVSDVSGKREELDKIQRRARTRLKQYAHHREQPYIPIYEGKWLSQQDGRDLRSFKLVPQGQQKVRNMVSIECFEQIPCNLCEKSCPENAIDFSKIKDRQLKEMDCTACGICLNACPAGIPVMMHEKENHPNSRVTFSWQGPGKIEVGSFVTLVNRMGESLGNGRAMGVNENLIEVEVPTHLIWDARTIRKVKNPRAQSQADTTILEAPAERVDITLNGEKRLVRDKVPVSLALFETGRARPEDVLFCPDGSCGLCTISIDGTDKKACQTQVHRGMAIRLSDAAEVNEGDGKSDVICPCNGVTRDQIVNRIHLGKLGSPEAIHSMTHVGSGNCKGQLCHEPFRRLLAKQKLDATNWIDWSFPWTEWVITPGSHE